MTYRVVVSAEARAAVRRAHEYLLKRFPGYASRWVAGMEAAILSLSSMPERCPRASEEFWPGDDTYQLLYEHYRILFTIRGNEVHVVRIRHTRRKPLRPKQKRRRD